MIDIEYVIDNFKNCGFNLSRTEWYANLDKRMPLTFFELSLRFFLSIITVISFVFLLPFLFLYGLSCIPFAICEVLAEKLTNRIHRRFYRIWKTQKERED